MITAKITWSILLFGMTFLVPPSAHLFAAVFTVIGLDFITGIIKAKVNDVARTSDRFRNTITKFVQYFFSIVLCFGAGKLLPDQEAILKQSAGYVMMFIVYIEVTSIFENLYEIDNKSVFSKFFIKPIMAILKFGVQKNPITQAAAKINSHENAEK